MSTFSKKILVIVAIIEAILLLFGLIVFQNGEIFLFFLVLALLLFGAFAGLLKIGEWLGK